ncbi:cation-translocating P-type ATPase [Aquabacterium sp. A7-Y]|uniref:heavy metal translocating P-type ATPase n=1 Tax=Aquabacterium sp. A7-Y TaxID=1349605 RepID=UPI00223E3D8E|nr:cation-translocating P-type ATPase [Aquabacterium sp. A7-Y]MCW7537773.1 cation-translocating P-type ATPase [Aquabacterium sp. A7-Y]
MASLHAAPSLSPKLPPDPSAATEAAAWDDPLELERYTRWSAPTDSPRVGDSVLAIEGMYCAACSLSIEQALLGVPGVLQAEVNPASRRARVRWDPQQTRASALAAAVAAAGYRALPALSLQAESERRVEQRRTLWRLFVAAFCMMQVMMYAVPVYVAGPGEMSADIVRLLQWASWLLSIPVLLFSSGPFLRGAWRDLARRRIGMDVPVALGIVVTFVVSTGATFEPGGVFGHEVYFDSLTMFVFFLLCGRALELRARAASAGVLESVMQRLPELVERLAADGSVEPVPAHRLRVGDRVRVRPGQAFPADARLLDGQAQVDEALLTGESRPQLRGAGDGVVAGSFNLSSPVLVEVVSTGADTRYAQIVAMMQRAATQRPELARLADRIAAPFLWGVLLLALAAGVAWWWVDPARSVWVMVSVLIVTCPCALSLATPSALLAATGALARGGVLVQRLQALEVLARARCFVFDKTGTLTEDRLSLAQLELFDGRPRSEALALAAALASASLHPVARAVREAGAAADARPDLPLHAIEEMPGQGLSGRDSRGREWRLGSAAFACPGVSLAGLDGPLAWLSVDGQAVARFDFEEHLRPDARAALAELRADGVELLLLSGDRPQAASRVAAALGIPHCRGGATPEDKLAAVQAVQARGQAVAMVGDGINDAPVLAAADVSIAMGQGAPLAQAQADLTLLSGRLADLVAARRLARRCLRVMRQNLAWAALYNGLCVPLALLGLLPPWLAGLGMAASSLFVVLNAARLACVPRNAVTGPTSAPAAPDAALPAALAA